jgi:hypothetical protein
VRKATIGMLVVLCLWGATSWQQSPPQWRVVLEYHVTGGTKQYSLFPIFTPQKSALYRVSGYCSATGQFNTSGWAFLFIWHDLGGGTDSASVGCTAGSPGPLQSNVTIFSPQAGVPVVLSANSSGDMSSTYNVAYTIEQLQ